MLPLRYQSYAIAPVSLLKNRSFISLLAVELRQRAYSRIFKQVEHRQFFLQDVSELALQLDHKQRMATEVKEIVINSYFFNMQRFHPYRRNGLFNVRPGEHAGCCH